MTTATQTKTAFTQTSDMVVEMSRIFDAPRELVWKACTEASAIPHWWGPAKLTTTVETMDLRPGGKWRFIQKDANGNIFGFNGEFREVDPPQKLVQTFEFEGMPGHIVLDAYTFEDLGNGTTRLTATSTFASPEDLQGMMQSGMESGAVESWERLAALLETYQ